MTAFEPHPAPPHRDQEPAAGSSSSEPTAAGARTRLILLRHARAAEADLRCAGDAHAWDPDGDRRFPRGGGGRPLERAGDDLALNRGGGGRPPKRGGGGGPSVRGGGGRPSVRGGGRPLERGGGGGPFDPGLEPGGMEQATAAMRRLGRRFDLVVSSPARRALDTAAVWGLPIRVDERLAERCFGEWEGRPWAELWPTVPPHVLADAEVYAAFTPPGAEPLEAVVARVRAAMRDLATEPGRRVLAVTHAGPLRLAVGAALGLPAWRALTLAAGHARAAVLDRVDDRWIVECLNC